MIVRLLREGLGRIIVFVNFITRPKPLKRSSEAQKRVDTESKGLSLYQFYACPFCVKVRRAMHRLNLPIEYRDAQKEGPFREELASEGGKVKVPCLRIEENGQVRWMYESNDIIAYLDKRFGSEVAA